MRRDRFLSAESRAIFAVTLFSTLHSLQLIESCGRVLQLDKLTALNVSCNVLIALPKIVLDDVVCGV